MVAKAKEKGGLKLVMEVARDVEKKFRDLYDRSNKQTPGGVGGQGWSGATQAKWLGIAVLKPAISNHFF